MPKQTLKKKNKLGIRKAGVGTSQETFIKATKLVMKTRLKAIQASEVKAPAVVCIFSGSRSIKISILKMRRSR